MTKFSILMTSHNSSEFLNEAIMSVLNQTNQDFELLIIDDASSDDTPKKLSTFASHKLVNVTYLKTNIGVSAVRNRLLSYAQGDYILFMDADDLLETNLLERLSQIIDQEIPDLIIYDFSRFADGIREIVSTDATYDKMYTSVWNKAYKSKTIRGLRFPIDIRLGEDTVFAVMTFKKSVNIVHLPVIGYQYRQRTGSLSHDRKAMPHVEAIEGIYRIKHEFHTDMPNNLKILLNQQLVVHAIFFVRDAKNNDLNYFGKYFLDVQDSVQPGLKHYDMGVFRGVKNNLFWWLFSKPHFKWLLKKYVGIIS